VEEAEPEPKPKKMRKRRRLQHTPPPKPPKKMRKKLSKEQKAARLAAQDQAVVGDSPPKVDENHEKPMMKKEQIPFSRIPADTKIDPKFGSNKYVSYDYAERAYQDLSVTKGKGFTKEKNKKKRGAYRGGAIDLAPKAIKFDD